MTKFDFEDHHVLAAIEWAKEDAKDRAQGVSYTRVFDAAGLARPRELHGQEPEAVTRFMARFHEMCKEEGLPPLDSLVVHVTTDRQGRPGSGYFKVNGWPDAFSDRTKPEAAAESAARWLKQQEDCGVWGTAERRAGR